MMYPPPSCTEIWNEELGDPIQEENAPWRHGYHRTEVYLRDSDGTYWQVQYCVSTDGETNDLREGHARIERVYPHQVTTTVYKTTEA